MPTHRVVTGTPAENISAADQLVYEYLGILKDLPLHRGIERIRQGVIRTGTDCSHRLPNPKFFAGVLERMRGVNAAMARVKNRPSQASTLALAMSSASWTRLVRM